MKQKIFSKDLMIIADIHEKKVADLLELMRIKVIRKRLDVADFICPGGIGIERKTHSDFIQSIIDGRIFRQAKELSEAFEKPVILIEGYSNRKINKNSIYGAIGSLIARFNISFLFSLNERETASLIYWISKKSFEKSNEMFFVVKKNKPKEGNVQLRILCQIPGISLKKAKVLLENFGNLERIFLASEIQLQKVKGIGPKLAKSIKKVFLENVKK